MPVYILNRYGLLVPVGVPGEICVGVDICGCGYINFNQTNEKYTEDIFNPGKLIYHTGDLGRWNTDGSITFLGRMDEQIKIRGFRIEPAEIEKVILSYEKVKQVFVTLICYKDKDCLTAYVVPEGVFDIKALRRYLLHKLPDYMVPEFIVTVPNLPVTINLKVDKLKLPLPDYLNKRMIEENNNMSSREKILFYIWSEVLGISDFGINDSFFELGGHSLLVLKTVMRINKAFGTSLSAMELFKAKTIKEQALLVESIEHIPCVQIYKSKIKEFYEVSPAQKRIYIIQQLNKTSTVYNMPFAFNISGELNVKRLNMAVNLLIATYDILKTEFCLCCDKIMQHINENVNYVIEESDTEDDFVRYFDLGKAPLFRIRLVKTHKGKYRLLFDIHHILMDGSSTEIFWLELSKAYNEGVVEKPCLQFKDYTEWLHVNMNIQSRQMKYWTDKLKGISKQNIQNDYKRPIIHSFKGDIYSFDLDKDTSSKLIYMANIKDVSVNMFLFALYCILLSVYSHNDDITVGMPEYGREKLELHNMIGMFANTLVIRSCPATNKSFAEYLCEVKQTLLEALDNHDVQFEDIVSVLNIERQSSRNPVFDTMFVYQNFNSDFLKLDGVNIKYSDIKLRTSRFDMTWYAKVKGNILHFDIEYSKDLFKEKTIKEMSECYKKILYKVLYDVDIKISALDFKIKNRRLKVHQINKTENSNYTSGNTEYIETKLLKIWKDTLKLNDIHIDDDFFELGGDSLKSMLLMHRINKEFNYDVAGSVVFMYPTVRKMSCYLSLFKAKESSFKSLVKISDNVTSNNIFCIHPAPGSVFCYHILKKYLDKNWTIYALQAQGLNKREKPLKTFEDMACEYIKEIKSVQPAGPYVLLGWSIGGKIAYEITKQLQYNGDDVKYLLMLDTDPLFYRKHRSSFFMYPYALFSLLTHGKTIWQNLSITSFNLFSLMRRIIMWMYLIRAAYIYIPGKLLRNTITVLLQTKEGEKREKRIRYNHSSITNYVTDLSLFHVEGSHMEMLSEPYVIENCNLINSILKK